MPPTQDPLVQAARLAADYGIRLDPQRLASRTDKAGTLDRPERSETDLTAEAVAVCDLVLRETADGPLPGEEPDPISALRLRMISRIASMLLPPVIEDYSGRFDLQPDEDGYLPSAVDIWFHVRHHAARLDDYIRGYDAGGWTDPYAVAGALADLHDCVRLVEVLLGCQCG